MRRRGAEPLLLAALSAVAVSHDRRRGHGCYHPGRCRRAGQHTMNPTGVNIVKSKPGYRPLPSLLYGQGRLRDRGVYAAVRQLRFLQSGRPRPPGQLYPGQSAGDAEPDRAGMVFPALLRNPAGGPEQASRRADRHVRLHPGLLFVLPWLDRPFQGALHAAIVRRRAGSLASSSLPAWCWAIAAPTSRTPIPSRAATWATSSTPI